MWSLPFRETCPSTTINRFDGSFDRLRSAFPNFFVEKPIVHSWRIRILCFSFYKQCWFTLFWGKNLNCYSLKGLGNNTTANRTEKGFTYILFKLKTCVSIALFKHNDPDVIIEYNMYIYTRGFHEPSRAPKLFTIIILLHVYSKNRWTFFF